MSTRRIKREKDEESMTKIEARNNLNRALESIGDPETEPEPEDPITESDGEGEEPEVKVKTEVLPVKNVRAPKQVPQASYIMKLFDRSVNLAKFDEETPLFTLCRAWMKNNPREQPSNNDEKQDDLIQHLEEGDVIEMPTVSIRKGARSFPQRKETKVNNKELDKTMDSATWTKAKLMEFHRKRWGAERDRNIDFSRNFEKKFFSENIDIIESLIKTSEE